MGSLGSVGRNVGAGMTGGIGYFYDESDSFAERVNSEIVEMQRISTVSGEAQLKNMIQRHHDQTNSSKAKMILDNWSSEVGKFWQIYPPAEAKSPAVKEIELEGVELRISAQAPDGAMCFLPVLVPIKGTPASPATARPSRVLPVPGGPSMTTPRG